MKPYYQKVLNETLNLPPVARAALAGHLVDSLDDVVDEDPEAAWSKQIARRIDDLDHGNVKTVPWWGAGGFTGACAAQSGAITLDVRGKFHGEETFVD
jgi:putative addiction module component (TIGR02574 family)